MLLLRVSLSLTYFRGVGELGTHYTTEQVFVLHKLLLTVLLAIRNLFMLQLQLARSRIDRRRLHVFFFIFYSCTRIAQ